MPVYDRANIFARILNGEEPHTKVHEDEFALAFRCVPARTPVHVLVIPKGEYVSNVDFCASASTEMIAGFWRAVATTAQKLGLEESGYRLVANHGHDGNQTVPHFHVHILGGRRMPPIAKQA